MADAATRAGTSRHSSLTDLEVVRQLLKRPRLLLAVLVVLGLAGLLTLAGRRVQAELSVARPALHRLAEVAAQAQARPLAFGRLGQQAEALRAAVAAARPALADPMVRVAGQLPLSRPYVSDARNLTEAAARLADGAVATSAIDDLLAPPTPATPVARVLDPAVLHRVAPLAAELSADLDAAGQLLDAVVPVPGSALPARVHDQVVPAVARLQRLAGLLADEQPLAASLGQDGPRRYLVVLLGSAGDAHLYGPALGTAVLRLDAGNVTVSAGPDPAARGSWTTVPGDEWIPEAPERSLDQALSAPFSDLAADEAARWAGATTGSPLDGVVLLGGDRLTALASAAGLPNGTAATDRARLTGLLTALTHHGAGSSVHPALEPATRRLALLEAVDDALESGRLAVRRTGDGAGASTATRPVADPAPDPAPVRVTLPLPVAGTRQLGVVDVVQRSTPEVTRRSLELDAPVRARLAQLLPDRIESLQVALDGAPITGQGSRDELGRRWLSVPVPSGRHLLTVSFQPLDDLDPGLDPRAPGSFTMAAFAPTSTSVLGFVWGNGGRWYGWLALCVLLVLVGRRRPMLPLGAALLLYGLVPFAAQGWLTGISGTGQGALALHPGTWLLLATAWVRRHRLLAAVRRRPGVAAGLLIVVLVATATALLRGSGGWSELVQALIAAPVLGLLVSDVAGAPRSRALLQRSFLGLGLGLAALAALEAVTGRALVWQSAYRDLLWFQVFARHGFRAPTTLGQPLNTALLLVAVLPTARTLLPSRWRLPAYGLVLAGILGTGSRVELALGLGYLLLGLRRPTRRPRRRELAAVTVAAAGLAAAMAPAVHHLVQRAVADGGSGSLRVQGVLAFWPHLTTRLLVGSGVGTSESLTRLWMHSPNSAENPLVMMAVDLGVVSMLVYVGALLLLGRLLPPPSAVLRGRLLPRGRAALAPPQVSLLLALLAALSFSSFATQSPSVFLLWFLAGLAAATAPASLATPTTLSTPGRAAPDLILQEDPVNPSAEHPGPGEGREQPVPPLVTALMAARNAAGTIAEAIGSVQAQSLTDWELVVIDDGSVDGTADVARSCAGGDPRVRVVRLPDGAGRGAARNVGLGYARGQLVAVCDADDRSRPDRFALQVAALQQDPQVAVVGGQVANFGDWGGPSQVYHYPLDAEQVAARLRRGQNPIPHQASMIRRRLLDEVGGYATDCVRAQDLELFLRLAPLCSAVNLPEVVLDYRHARRTALAYWLDNARWRRFAVARARAALDRAPLPMPQTFHARPCAVLLTGYDTLAYARSRGLLALRGSRAL